MARSIASRTAREKLKPTGQPYYQTIRRGLSLGYRKPLAGAGKWICKMYLVDGKYLVTNIGVADDLQPANNKTILSYAQAVAALATVETESDIPSGPYSVAQASAAYLAHLEAEGRAAAAVHDAKYKIDRYILPTLGRLQVSTLQAKGLRQWRDDLAKPNTRAKRATANRIWTTLRAALNLAFQREEVPSDNAWRRVKPFKGVESARLRYLTIPEVKLLVEACPPDFRLLVEAALQTGARYSELTRLMPPDFNADAGTLHIRQSKSGKARHIILSDEGQALFAKIELPLRKSDGKHWGRSDQVRRMADAVKAAGIEEANFHSLRHTWASHAVMNGVPLLVVARNLGHSTTRMVEQHYGHMSESHISDAIRRGAPKFT